MKNKSILHQSPHKIKEEEEKEKNQMREHDDEIVRIHTTHDDGC